MDVEIWVLAGGVFLAAVLICHNIRIWKWMQEREAQLKGIQELINVLQESHSLGTEHAIPNAEIPKIDTPNTLVGIGGAGVGTAIAALNAVSVALETRMRRPLLRTLRYTFSRAQILLIITVVAIPLVYFFALERSSL